MSLRYHQLITVREWYMSSLPEESCHKLNKDLCDPETCVCSEYSFLRNTFSCLRNVTFSNHYIEDVNIDVVSPFHSHKVHLGVLQYDCIRK